MKVKKYDRNVDRLVKQLSEDKHPVIFEPRTEKYDEMKERLVDMKYVFIKFKDTIGETEIGINVDDNLTDLKDADFVNGKGKMYIVGTSELNYHKVKCIAKINLKTKTGTAYLEIIS